MERLKAVMIVVSLMAAGMVAVMPCLVGIICQDLWLNHYSGSFGKKNVTVDQASIRCVMFAQDRRQG